MQLKLTTILLVCLLTLIAGCGSSLDDDDTAQAPNNPNTPTAPTTPITTTPDTEQIAESTPENVGAASSFLQRATFGPSYEDIQTMAGTTYGDWLQQQFSAQPTYGIPYAQSKNWPKTDNNNNLSNDERTSTWWHISMKGEDQLRQRMAFALSQIMVISDKDAVLGNRRNFVAEYYDVLVENAFGNYRDLLEAVTLNPAMGEYLSMIRNEKTDPVLNLRPDEDYAREVMQLFSIGLNELNIDGTEKIGSNGSTIPTYDQATIEGFAKVFTGWNYSDADNWNRKNGDPATPMKAFPDRHSTAEKTLLNGVVLPPNQSAEADMRMALDNIFNHENVGPFISKQLIQRFVTSNPTPEYVTRVASVFNDNGSGVRGDLAAVLTAVLLDDEAINGHTTMPNSFGRVREPIMKIAAMYRAFDVLPVNDTYSNYDNVFNNFNQGPIQSPSVFNFYRPDYKPSGTVANADLVSPEMQIIDERQIVAASTDFFDSTQYRNNENDNYRDYMNIIQLQDYKSLLQNDDPSALIDRLNLVLMANQMPTEMQQTLKDMYNSTYYNPEKKEIQQLTDILYLIMISPQYAVQQ